MSNFSFDIPQCSDFYYVFQYEKVLKFCFPISRVMLVKLEWRTSLVVRRDQGFNPSTHYQNEYWPNIS